MISACVYHSHPHWNGRYMRAEASCVLFMFCPHAQTQSWYPVNVLNKNEQMHPKHILINIYFSD